MGFKFTIGKKIGAGFGIVILLTIIAFIFTNITLNDSKKRTDDVVQVVTPSVAKLNEFNLLLESSQRLITKWVYVTSVHDEPFKTELKALIKTKYPQLKVELDSLSKNWVNEDQNNTKSIIELTDKLFADYQSEIMEKVVSFESYDDSQIIFPAKISLED